MRFLERKSWLGCKAIMGVIRIVSVPVSESYGSSHRDLAISAADSRIQVQNGGAAR